MRSNFPKDVPDADIPTAPLASLRVGGPADEEPNDGGSSRSSSTGVVGGAAEGAAVAARPDGDKTAVEPEKQPPVAEETRSRGGADKVGAVAAAEEEERRKKAGGDDDPAAERGCPAGEVARAETSAAGAGGAGGAGAGGAAPAAVVASSEHAPKGSGTPFFFSGSGGVGTSGGGQGLAGRASVGADNGGGDEEGKGEGDGDGAHSGSGQAKEEAQRANEGLTEELTADGGSGGGSGVGSGKTANKTKQHKKKNHMGGGSGGGGPPSAGEVVEIDYCGILNRVLPPDVRALAWAPVTEGFSARFSCSDRTYRRDREQRTEREDTGGKENAFLLSRLFRSNTQKIKNKLREYPIGAITGARCLARTNGARREQALSCLGWATVIFLPPPDSVTVMPPRLLFSSFLSHPLVVRYIVPYACHKRINKKKTKRQEGFVVYTTG